MAIWDLINSSTEAIAGGAAKSKDITVGAAAKGRDASWWAAHRTIDTVKTIGSSTGAIAGGATVKVRDASWWAAHRTIDTVKTIGSSTGAIAGGATVKARDATLSAASWTMQTVKDRAPDREGWEKIGRLGCRVADHALAEVTRPYTAGIPVYRFAKEEYFGNLKNPSFKDQNKSLELQEALKRLNSLEKELKEIQLNKSGEKVKIEKEYLPKFVNWKPVEWDFVIE